MHVVRFVKNTLRACRPVRSTDDARGLALYRHLRRAENNLLEARERLNGELAAQQKNPPACAACAPGGGGCRCDQQPAGVPAAGISALHPDIEHLMREVARLEAEYQNAQMHVRAYFYKETCPVSLPQGELTAGHPAQ